MTLKLFLRDIKIYLWILFRSLSKFFCMGIFILFSFVIQHKMRFYSILRSQVSDKKDYSLTCLLPFHFFFSWISIKLQWLYLAFFPARGRGPTASTTNAHHTNPRSTASTSNTHHTNPRQAVCSHCQETGHSSNDCPSQTRRSRNPQYPGMNQQNGKISGILKCHSRIDSLEK